MDTVEKISEVIIENEEPPKVNSLERASRVLRYIGAILLLGAAVAFSLQGWAAWGSIMRHAAFIGFALSLSALGMLCGVQFKEDKGARTFLGVAVAVIPALFAQLGAMFFAHFYNVQHAFPDFVRYTAPAISVLIPLALVSIACSVLISYLGFRVFHASGAKTLTKVFILSNALILLPVRAEGIVALIVLAQIVMIVLSNHRYLKDASESKTWEGYAARAIVLVPSAFVIGRAALLYNFAGYCTSLCLLVAGVLLLQQALAKKDRAHAKFFRFYSLATLAASWMFFIQGVRASILKAQYGSALARGIARFYLDFEAMFELLPIAGICAIASLLFQDKGRGYRTFAGVLSAYVGTYLVFTTAGILSSLLCLLIGSVMLVAAFVLEEKGLLLAGIYSFFIGIVFQVGKALAIYTFSPWATLALGGIIVVGSAVYLERRGEILCNQATAFRQRIYSWQ